MSIIPQGMSIQSLYRNYRGNKLIVNRKYQRKLVWTLEEKRALIDSILAGLPIPLFLLGEKETNYEIIDGMQRLFSIFSFIENGFSFNERYFDLNEFATARQLAENGVFKKIDSIADMLDKKSCANFLDYQLAVTIFPAKSDEIITDVFNRINSYGRRLSPQEQRQVATISDFSDTIRRLASDIRGDASKDTLLLHEMPEISIDSGTLGLGYGIIAEDCFWVKQGILNTSLLRKSEDEQLIADIVISILLGAPFASSKEALDDAYDPDSQINTLISTSLIKYKSTRLSEEIKTVFSVLQDCLSKKPKGYLRGILRSGDNKNPIKTEFYALFMAFFDLIIKKEMTPLDFEKLFTELKDVSSKMHKDSHYITPENRTKNINVIIGLIQNLFVKKDPSLLGHGLGLYLDLVNSIKRSKVETSRYEFKQGIVSLDNKRKIDESCLEEIFKTIAAIANCGKGFDTGFIFIGIADKNSDAQRILELDKVQSFKIDDRNIVGVEREAKATGKSLDQYYQLIVEKLKNSGLSNPLKTQVLNKIDLVDCQGLQIIRISIPSQNEVSFYNDDVYLREGNSTKRADGKQSSAITAQFLKNN